MSILLIKRSLNLVTDSDNVAANSNKQSVNQRKRGGKVLTTEIKQKYKIANRKKDSKKSASLVVEKIRQRAKNEKEVDKVKLNLQKLKQLSETTRIHKNLETQILKKLYNKKGTNSNKRDKKERTAFTEQDFASFEKEYFNS